MPFNLQDWLEQREIEVRPVARAERWSLGQRWRETYCRSVYAETGKWVVGGHTWNAFAPGRTKAINGIRAMHHCGEYELFGVAICPGG
jgi:hypothetical protein